MTAFEVVFVLVTIITSLAITHQLSGFVSILRNSKRVRFSLLSTLWAWIAFTSVIANWASFWAMRSVTSWPSWAVLMLLACFVIQYIFCALVTPEIPSEGKIDLVEFHHRERRRYISAFIALLVAALILNFLFGRADLYAEWQRDTVLAIVMLVLALIALLVGVRWVQISSALIQAVVTTYYMVVTCNVVAA